jgi:hypothetical protein
VKKKVIFSLFVALAVGFTSKAVFAFASNGAGGIVAVMVALVSDENKSSKSDSTEAPSTLKGEFASLNNRPENLDLIQQSAGGSADLKAILN